MRGAAVAGLRVQAGGDRGPGAHQAVAGGQESVHPGPQGCNVYNYHTYNVGMFIIIIIDVIIYVLYIYNLGDGHSLGLLR